MNAYKNLYEEIAANLAAGKPFIVATIVEKEGSSPREAGAKMLIYPDGKISGTIGGGNFEAMVINDSLKLFAADEKCILKEYLFSPQGPASTGMHCGGKAEVFFERKGKPDRLLIFGGGHVGTSLAKIVEGLDFRVTVIDEKQESLDTFKPTIEKVRTDPGYDENLPEMDDHSYVVIVTSSHASDMAILEKAVKKNCAYVGMIGSRKKVETIFSALKEKGIDEDHLKKVYSPIGLSIGAEGPDEIAISIAAQLIKVKRQK